MPACILVVDDILPNLRLLEAKLVIENFQVILVNSGQKALDILNQQHVDLVLLDVMMPEMDGFEVCQRIRSNSVIADLPVVMITAFGDIQHRVRSLEVGADDFLTKPINDIALFARVRSLLQLKFLLDELNTREKTLGDFYLLPSSNTSIEDDLAYDDILLIHESGSTGEKIKKTLEDVKSKVTYINNDQDVVKAIHTHDYSLIILSLGLENNKNLELLSFLRSEDLTRRIPILLTGDESQLLKFVAGLDMGASDYFLRPIEKAEVLLRCKTQLRKSSCSERLKSLQNMSVSATFIDHSTGLYNKKYLLRYLEGSIKNAIQMARPVSLIMMSIDFIGEGTTPKTSLADIEKMMGEIGKKISAYISISDLLIRMGSHDLAILTMDTPTEVAVQFAKKLRQYLVKQSLFQDQQAIKIKISLGITSSSGANLTSGSFLQKAEKALLDAKQKPADNDQSVIVS
ncbi:MAG: response regulator [Rhodospirillaceae bacterium]|nr:response regulator [Rhodospirillaceae bacterium]